MTEQGKQDKKASKKSATKKTKKPKKPGFFATENPDDPVAVGAMATRAGHHAMFSQYADYELIDTTDHDREIAQMCRSTGFAKGFVDSSISAYMCLSNLPALRKLQEETHRLDLNLLIAVSKGLNELGDNVAPEVYAAFDAMLVDLFTPRRMNQALPLTTSVTRRIHDMIAQFDSSAAYDAKKQKKREKTPKPVPPGQCDVEFFDAGLGHTGMEVRGDNTTMAATKAAIDAAAREHGITQAEALLKLITGKITPSPKAVIYGYAPKLPDGGIDPAAPVFLPGFGITTAPGTEMFHHIASDEKSAVFYDLDDAATEHVKGYVAPERIKAYSRGRDGTCIFPGCTASAWRCQLDHRVPYDEGGATTADNLYCLCAHHHNFKTDKRGYYVPDPVTGDIVWLFDDGTYALTQPEGFITSQVTPVAPRWRHSLEDIERLKRKKAHFFAQGHKLIDDYENSHRTISTYRDCISSLEDLEKEFASEFPFRPERPEESDGNDAPANKDSRLDPRLLIDDVPDF